MIDRSAFAGWVWPVPITNGRTPVVSHEFEGGNRYLPNGALNYAVHLGLDLMFPRMATDPTGPLTDVAIPRHGSNPGWITWPDTIVRAAGPGHVWEAGETALGHHVLIDHGKVGGIGMLTFYQHLVSLTPGIVKGSAFDAGDELGIMGGDPSNAPHLRHLHFEVWLPDGKPNRGDWPVDPAPFLALWSHGDHESPLRCLWQRGVSRPVGQDVAPHADRVRRATRDPAGLRGLRPRSEAVKPRYPFCWWCSRKLERRGWRELETEGGPVIVHGDCAKEMLAGRDAWPIGN